MTYPVPEEFQLPVFVVALVATGILGKMMPGSLQTAMAPCGIVSLELAGTGVRARAILAAWDVSAKNRAIVNTRLDFLFAVAYSTAASVACIWALGRPAWEGSLVPSIGLALAWGQWVAGLLDFMENFALLRMLFGQTMSPWPQAASAFAVLKFALLLDGLVFVVSSCIAQAAA